MHYLETILDENQIAEIKDTFDNSIFSQLDDDNVKAIIVYLQLNHINVIEDIILQYLDLFLMEKNKFIEKFEILKKQYPYNFEESLAYQLNLLDEMID